MKKSIAGILIAVALIGACVALAGCTGTTAPSAGNSKVTPGVKETTGTTTITDGYGRTVVIPAKTETIVCSGSGCLRYVSYLGAQGKVVGVDSIEKTPQPVEGRA